MNEYASAEVRGITHVDHRSPWKEVDRWCICTAIFLVVASIIGMTFALVGCFHAPQVFLVSLLITALYVYATRSRTQALPGATPKWRHVLLLILVALPLRVPAYHYVMGGQDEGVYVNIAHYLQRTGGVEVHNDVRAALQHTPFLNQYVASNHTGGSYLPGVYKGKGGGGKLEFQFYDLFPVWMALFIGIFGGTFGVYAQTLFALLSILFLYRLILLVTGRSHAALMGAGLLVLSPLHVFFSKFPVTEIPTLCFSLLGFLLLAAYCSAHLTQRKREWLLLSVLAFLCVFVTRISGFMYVPFVIALAWAALLLDRDKARRRNLQYWAMGVSAAYLLSVVYGLARSSHYAHDIYVISFQPLLGERWKAMLALLAVGVCIVWLVTCLWARRHSLGEASRRWNMMAVQWLPAVIVWAAFCLGLLKIYRMGWTNDYAGIARWARWHLAGTEWSAAMATSLWTLLVYLGPLLLMAFLVSIFSVQRDPRMQFLRWITAGFFVYVVLLQWVIPYSPYYARYLLSEAVPCMVLVTVFVWSGLRKGRTKRALSCVMVVSLLYGATLSAQQVGKNENQGAYSSLAHIAAATSPSDLILLDRSTGSSVSWGEVGTSLIYTFDRTVVGVNQSDLEDSAYLQKLGSLRDRIFLLTSRPGPPSPGFRYVASSRFKVMQYQHNHSFPHKLVVGRNYPLNLYVRVPGSVPIAVGQNISFADGGAGVTWLKSSWSHPEAWGTWSLGKRAVLSIHPKRLPAGLGDLELRIQANVLVNTKHPSQHVVVRVDGKRVASYVGQYPARHLIMRIPISQEVLRRQQPILVTFLLPNAISPAAISSNRDARRLAIGLVSAKLVAETSASSAVSH